LLATSRARVIQLKKRGFNVLSMKWRVISAWPYSSVLFEALGAEVVKQRAAKGEGEAQFSQGCLLVRQADGNAGSFGAGGRSPKADVGWHFPPTCFESLIGPRRVDVVT